MRLNEEPTATIIVDENGSEAQTEMVQEESGLTSDLCKALGMKVC